MGWPDSLPLNPVVDPALVRDGRARFRAILSAVNASHGRALSDYRATETILRDLGREHEAVQEAGDAPVGLQPIPTTVRIVAIPGFMTECVAFLCDVLTDGLAHLASLGAQTLAPRLDGRGRPERNAMQIRDAIMTLPEGETVILVAMSKGAADCQEMLALFPETRTRVAALVSLVGAVCGSPLAHLAPGWLKWIEAHVPLPHCRAHGGEAVHSLKPEVRRAFLQTHAPVPGIRYYSVCAAVETSGLSKGMLSAHRALNRYDVLNDGQMLLGDQILPQSEVLAVLNCDHIAAGMPFNRNRSILGRWVSDHVLNRNAFPREVVMEAVVRRVLEDLQIS